MLRLKRIGVPAQPAEFPSLKFPADRMVLQVAEVAKRLRVCKYHVVGLIEEGKLRAINVAGSSATGRKCYRIPLESWEAYVRENLM
jgi:excisionase family DNA binding protein